MMARLADDYVITRADADELIRRGACREGAEAFIGMTVAEAVEAEPWSALRFATDWLSDQQFAEAAKATPWAALEYAADRLSDYQFVEAAKSDPWAARSFATARYRQLVEGVSLAEWEREVLKKCAGLPSRVRVWGAAAQAAMGVLIRRGYVTSTGRITLDGRAVLEGEG